MAPTSSPVSSTPPTPVLVASATPPPAPAAPPPPALSPVEEGLAQLLQVRRLHVETLSGGDAANQLRDMIIASFQSAGFFMITENPERADAYLRGTAEDLIFVDQFSSSESLGFRSSVGAGRGRTSSSNGYERNSAAMGVSQNEHTDIKERKHEALAAVRIVSKEGDVIWSTTQESFGAKFRGASADVAEKITRQLKADIDRARKLPSLSMSGPSSH